jgi:CMP-N-acetylneuraminic acid synthetase
MKIIGVIPARGGSKGIPRKNIQLFDSKPLIFYSIEAANKSLYLENFFVSTDDHEIASISKNYGAHILWRDVKLSSDTASAFEVIQDVFKNIPEVEIIVYLQPTSPLRTYQHIDAAIEKFLKGKYNSLVSITKVPHNFSALKQLRVKGKKLTPLFEEKFNIVNRQDIPVQYARNGPAILITKRKTIEQGDLYGETVFPFVMDEVYSIDIDNEYDFALAELIKKNILSLKSRIKEVCCDGH